MLLKETHLDANHLLKNHIAIVCGTLLLNDQWLNKRSDHYWNCLFNEIEKQIDIDGMHYERTPGYQIEVIHDLLVVLTVMQCMQTDKHSQYEAQLKKVLSKSLKALAVVTHADGFSAAFGDTAPYSAGKNNPLLEWARNLKITASEPKHLISSQWNKETLSASGFSKLSNEHFDLYLTHGDFGAPYQPGHAHCDLFGFELDLNGQRLIVDPGVHAYHDEPWRHRTRSTQSHNTIAIEGYEQSEIWHKFRCGWKSKMLSSNWKKETNGWTFIGEALAFGPKSPIKLIRHISFTETTITFCDQTSSNQSLQVNFSLANKYSLKKSNSVIIINDNRNRQKLLLTLFNATASIVQNYISHHFGERKETQSLKISQINPKEVVKWTIETIKFMD